MFGIKSLILNLTPTAAIQSLSEVLYLHYVKCISKKVCSLVKSLSVEKKLLGLATLTERHFKFLKKKDLLELTGTDEGKYAYYCKISPRTPWRKAHLVVRESSLGEIFSLVRIIS